MNIATQLILTSILASGSLMMSSLSVASPVDFKHGKTIPEFGKIAHVNVDQPVYKHHKFKVVFDVSKRADIGELNRSFESAARFINMHTEAGVKEKNIKIAIVVHGKAAFDMTRASSYAHSQDGDDKHPNVNALLIKSLQEHGVTFYVCGQTAAHYDIKNEDLLDDVQMSLSAMTAHALLQQKGYTLNPF